MSVSARRRSLARWLSSSSITTTQLGLPRAQLFHVGAAVVSTATTSPSPYGFSTASGWPVRSESSRRTPDAAGSCPRSTAQKRSIRTALRSGFRWPASTATTGWSSTTTSGTGVPTTTAGSRSTAPASGTGNSPSPPRWSMPLISSARVFGPQKKTTPPPPRTYASTAVTAAGSSRSMSSSQRQSNRRRSAVASAAGGSTRGRRPVAAPTPGARAVAT